MILGSLHQFLHLTNGIAVLLDFLEQPDLLSRTLQRQQGTGMSHADGLVLQSHLNLCGEFQQTQVVGHSRATLSHTFRHFLLCHTAGFQQMLISQGDLDIIQILTLDVLHQRHLHHLLILDGTDIGG